MELRKAFPDSILHGINLEPWPQMRGSESLRDTAVHYGIYDAAQAAGVALPEIHFYDASELRFPDGHFDAVVSQVTVPYVPAKANLIEEVWRSLKPGGMAFLHIDSTRHDEADFLCGDTPCFVVYRDKKRIGVSELLAGVRAQGFDLRYGAQRFRDGGREQLRFLLIMTKSKDQPLRLNLTLDPHSSFDLTRLHKVPADWKSLWGFRSVYR
jgi:SAM-dependent methyltransferase